MTTYIETVPEGEEKKNTQISGKGKTYKSVLRWDMSQCLYMYTFTPFCRSARRIPSIIDAWFNASEKIAIFSSSEGILFPAKREPMLPIAVIKAILAANPVGQRRQSYSMDFKPKWVSISYNLDLLSHMNPFFNSLYNRWVSEESNP